MASKKPPMIDRRIAPYSNVQESEWGQLVENRLSTLETKTEERHKENKEAIHDMKQQIVGISTQTAENKAAIEENTRITKAGFEELLPVVRGLRVAKSTGQFAWAGAIMASKVGRWAAGFVGLVTTVLYLLHEKWIDAWRAFLKMFQ